MQTMPAHRALRRPDFRAILMRTFDWLRQRWPQPTPRLTDRMARDAGLSVADQERLTLEWPSQTMRHPML